MSIENHKHAGDLTGLKFGRLTVTSICESRGRHRMYWLCICDCQKEKWVISDALKSGMTQSCGCLNDEVRRSPIHGGTQFGQTPEYKTWHHMKQRCMNPTNHRYSQYGERGIKVCEQWMNSFPNFLNDMGHRPEGSSIERINNDGDYEPSNCRWASNTEQSRNTSRTRYFSFQGMRLCLTDWARLTGIPRATLHNRLAKWSLEKALTHPVKGKPQASS